MEAARLVDDCSWKSGGEEFEEFKGFKEFKEFELLGSQGKQILRPEKCLTTRMAAGACYIPEGKRCRLLAGYPLT